MKIKTALIWSDCHLPWVNENFLFKTLEIAQDFNLKEIISIGDFLDFLNLSLHPKNLNIKVDFKEEIERNEEIFQKINDITKVKKTVTLGNHSISRLRRYINKNCPELHGVLEFEDLAKFNKYKWKTVDYGPNQLYQLENTDLYFRHEPYSGGQNYALSSLRKGLVSLCTGHVHKQTYVCTNTANGKQLRFLGTGCMVDLSHEAFNYTKNFKDWQVSACLIHYDYKGSWWHEWVSLIDNKIRFRNKIYSI